MPSPHPSAHSIAFFFLGDLAVADAVHEEASGSDHRSVPRGWEGVYSPAAAGAAAFLHLSRPLPLLGLLDPSTPLPRNHWWIILSTLNILRIKYPQDYLIDLRSWLISELRSYVCVCRCIYISAKRFAVDYYTAIKEWHKINRKPIKPSQSFVWQLHISWNVITVADRLLSLTSSPAAVRP